MEDLLHLFRNIFRKKAYPSHARIYLQMKASGRSSWAEAALLMASAKDRSVHAALMSMATNGSAASRGEGPRTRIGSLSPFSLNSTASSGVATAETLTAGFLEDPGYLRGTQAVAVGYGLP